QAARGSGTNWNLIAIRLGHTSARRPTNGGMTTAHNTHKEEPIMSASQRSWITPWLGALSVALLSLVSAAQQADAHTRTFRFGKAGAGNGEFNLPSSMAVDPEGNLFVADMFNNRIQKFTSAGVFLRSYGRQGFGDGLFLNPAGVAISRS